MPIRLKYNGKPFADIDAAFEGVETAAANLEKRIIMATQAACLNIVTMARNLPSPGGELRKAPHQPHYIDDTGVLRASIGFSIYDRGRQVVKNFGGGDGEGLALAACNEVAAKFPNTIVAVIVAGADYAAAVESKGYFVLSEPVSHLSEQLRLYYKNIKI